MEIIERSTVVPEAHILSEYPRLYTNPPYKNNNLVHNKVGKALVKIKKMNKLRESSNATPNVDFFTESSTSYSCFEYLLISMSYILLIILFPLMLFTQVRIINDYERGLVLRLGKVKPTRKSSPIAKPGVHLLLPGCDQMLKVDLRVHTVNIAPQDILTKDSVSVLVDAVVYMRITNPTFALLRVAHVKTSAQLLAVSILRTVLGQHSLVEILNQRKEIDLQLKNILDDATDPWGVKIERVEIIDVKLPVEMQRAMAAEAQAERAAKAKVIAADGELNASRALRQAATEIERSPTALQLRYLQTLGTIATEKNSTIVFPLPMDLLPTLAKKS